MSKILIPLLFISFLSIQCSSPPSKQANSPNVIYTVDKGGVYNYNATSKETHKLASFEGVFLDHSLRFIDTATIIFGFGYFLEKVANTSVTQYVEEYKTVNIQTKEVRLHKVIEYTHIQMDTLIIKSKTFEQDNRILEHWDTLYDCNESSTSYAETTFCGSERFYSESEEIAGRKVFSRKGNLYLREAGNDRLLLDFDGKFSMKFGGGYSNPCLSADGQRVVCQYLKGFLSRDKAIIELDISTMTQKRVSVQDFYEPKYSADGIYILVAKKPKQNKENDSWIRDIYALNLKTGETTKVGSGSQYIWVQ